MTHDDPLAAPPRPVDPATRPRLGRALRLAASAAILAVSVLAGAVVWQFYVLSPWTRDGQVRAQVANVAPQVSGPITALAVTDNQVVRRGDLLFSIDPFDYRTALAAATAEVASRAADLKIRGEEAASREALGPDAISEEEKQRYVAAARMAQAAHAAAQAREAQARIDLERTEVRSPVNGYVTNLLLSVGTYAETGRPALSLVNADTFWVDGYFEETKLARIRPGAAAEIRLMGSPIPLRGRVESITRGIAAPNAAAGPQGLPSVAPVYTWVRLAQRVPVRIRIDEAPRDLPLVAGLTATVALADPDGRDRGLAATVLANLGGAVDALMGRAPPAVVARAEGGR
ncbi:HlyD family secretion protein [uncultured Methylobacterium sp.]|jgi:multidrug resistance efflux pump|uniref:efflux RND transporter periplasmic adaptor subunit n=1 Tax=uncultured Methylobacterium sp. TaxID=157278 RepID=UPI00262DAC58|nr:HlyD family secretion protein [uncultured Methylobacterium sp.]